MPADTHLRVREDLLLTLLGRWCSLRTGRDLFVKVLADNDQDQQHKPHPHGQRPLRFGLLKLVWATDHLVRVHMGFFGLSGSAVRHQVWVLQKALISADGPLLLAVEPVAYQLVLGPQGGNVGILPRYPTIQASAMWGQSYLLCRRWTWPLGTYTDLLLILDILARAQMAAGFTLVHKSGQEALLIQHVPLFLSLEDEAHGAVTQQSQQPRPKAAQSAMVQYRVLVEVPHGLSTELWMEPQFGFGSVGHQGPAAQADVWRSLAAACHERGRRLLSALDSFSYIRHLCSHTDPATATAWPSTPREQGASPRGDGRGTADVPSDLNMLEVLRGAEKTELTLHLFLPPPADQAPRTSQQKAKGEEEEEEEEAAKDSNNRHLHALTERTLRTLLGTEIPMANLSAAGDRLREGSAAARRQRQDLLWKVELGLSGWREGKCFAHQVTEDALSIWFLPPYRPQQAGQGESGEAKRPQMTVKIFVITSQQLLDRLIAGAGGAPRPGRPDDAAEVVAPLPLDNPLLAYISYLHRRNFTQVAYMALRAGQPIAPADLRDALGFCSEIGMDVDLTHLRKVALATAEVRQRLKAEGMMRLPPPAAVTATAPRSETTATTRTRCQAPRRKKRRRGRTKRWPATSCQSPWAKVPTGNFCGPFRRGWRLCPARTFTISWARKRTSPMRSTMRWTRIRTTASPTSLPLRRARHPQRSTCARPASARRPWAARGCLLLGARTSETKRWGA